MMVQEIEEYKKSRILVGEKLENLMDYIPENISSLVLVTDENLKAFYQSKFPDYPTITIGVGEKIKTWQTVEFIIEELVKIGADRHTFLVGIGGGIVCDITGYVASIYMRGIRFGYVSTSLLSQVDASVGGKTGVNFRGFKNLIGVFNQPEFVICDTSMLRTLPMDEIKNGLVELIKHSIICDAELFAKVESRMDEILRLNFDVLQELIYESIKIKTAIVNRDEREKGERKKLNLGHTIGHAIESLTGIPHGQAIALGLISMAELSYHLGHCNREDMDKVKKLISILDMPKIGIPSNKELMNLIMKDKKKNAEKIDFVFMKEIGKVSVEEIPFKDLELSLNQV